MSMRVVHCWLHVLMLRVSVHVGTACAEELRRAVSVSSGRAVAVWPAVCYNHELRMWRDVSVALSRSLWQRLQGRGRSRVVTVGHAVVSWVGARAR